MKTYNLYQVTMMYQDEKGHEVEYCRQEVAESENEACSEAERKEPEAWAHHATLLESDLQPV